MACLKGVKKQRWDRKIVGGDRSRVPKAAVDLCKLIGFDAGESLCITEDGVGERISKKGQRIAA